MKHNLSISVSKNPKIGSILACRTVTMREKLMRLFFGLPHKVTIFIPGETVDTVSISEIKEGGINYEQNQTSP